MNIEAFPYVHLHMHKQVVKSLNRGNLILTYKGQQGVAMKTYSFLAPG